MASIVADRIGIEFTAYGASARSLRGRLLRASVGGLMGIGQDRLVHIEALSDISFSLSDGDRLGLIGSNGAGKSTLLRVLAGVYFPGRGTLTVDGEISPIFDAAAGMDLDVSGQENIFLRGIYLGITPGEIRRKMQDIVEFTELGDYLLMPARIYSTGMLTRLAFAISTAFTPDILLLDEGIGSVDIGFMAKAMQRLDNLAGRARILVLATHDQGFIRRLCNKVAWLDHGRLIAMGDVDEVLSRYTLAAGKPFAP